MDCFNDSNFSGDNSDTRLAYSGFILTFSRILLQYAIPLSLLKNEICPGYYSCEVRYFQVTMPVIIPK
jgi:hypothetical protein